jgi:hypothetical protein
LSSPLGSASQARRRWFVAERGRPKSTDGPFVETKEHLGGFYLIEAPDMDTAIEWASRVSDAIGEPIEIRALVGSRGR